jgi:hypothetical protein
MGSENVSGGDFAELAHHASSGGTPAKTADTFAVLSSGPILPDSPLRAEFQQSAAVSVIGIGNFGAGCYKLHPRGRCL